jgi:hypothetical protein
VVFLESDHGAGGCSHRRRHAVGGEGGTGRTGEAGGSTPNPAKPAPAPAAAKPATAPATQAKPTAGAAAAPIDTWPRAYTTPGKGNVMVYEPQIASWEGQKQMVAFAAASYQPPGASGTSKPAMGTVKIEARTAVSLDERLVNFANMRITEANFPNLPKPDLQNAVAEITKAIPEADRMIALDRVLAFVDKSTIKPKEVPGLKADPPRIFYSQTPAVIVNFDGDPIWSPIEKNDLKFAVNTNWDVFEHEPTKTFYLRHNQGWLTATSFRGPWTPAGKLPPSFSSLPATDNFKEVKAAVPGKTIASKDKPEVFVSTEPAEMILLRGAPSYLLVQGTKDLLWVQNTDSDVFRIGNSGPVYYLVSGRWFSAPDFTGPWTFASTKLPEDFKRIPLEHERSRVLASVPGTDQAIEAVLLAQVPQTARVNRATLQAPAVGYNGQPQFKPIEGTQLQRAENTDKDIIFDGKSYYFCYQGVWFTSNLANGPWVVAQTVPASIYTIPASSPAHHVTYVTIEEDDEDNDEWVTFAYVAGYTGLMIGWGCAVWGSGWYYPPYYYGGIYYPHFPSYGYSAWYNPWTGGYGRSAVAYGPYGGMGVGARYNPRTGTYARGAAAWGPYGATGAAHAWNPRTGAYGQTRQGSNVYGSWGSTSVVRGDDWAQTNRVTNRVTGNTTRVTRTDDGAAVSRRNPGQGGGFVAAGEGGDVYAGRDGNVYRREDGTWQKHDNGGWSNVDRPNNGATVDQLERDRSSRSSGAERTSNYGTARSTGATRSGGNYRGASRGGGGRRR